MNNLAIKANGGFITDDIQRLDILYFMLLSIFLSLKKNYFWLKLLNIPLSECVWIMWRAA